MDGEAQLIKTDRLRGIAMSVAGVFLNTYLFRAGGVSTVVWYNAASFVALYPAYFATGYLLRRRSGRELIRWGLSGLAVLYLAIFLLGTRSVEFVVPLGLLSGITLAFYWAGFNITEYVLTHRETRHEYFGKIRMWSNVVRGLAPLLAGSVVSVIGYVATKNIGYAALFFILAVLLWLSVLESGELPAFSGSRFTARKLLRHDRPRRWRWLLIQQFMSGFWDSSFAALAPILMLVILKEEVVVGAYGTAGALLIGAGSYVAGKLLHQKAHRYLWGALLVPFGMLYFAFQQNVLGVLVLLLSRGFFLPLLNNTIDKTYYDTMDGFPGEWADRYHYILEREFALNLARVLSFVVLLLVLTPQNQLAVATDWMMVLSIFPLLAGLSQLFIESEQGRR